MQSQRGGRPGRAGRAVSPSPMHKLYFGTAARIDRGPAPGRTTAFPRTQASGSRRRHDRSSPRATSGRAIASATERPPAPLASGAMQTLPLPSGTSLLERAGVFAEHWRQGARFRVPVCCRLHFCIDVSLGRVAGVVRWREIAGRHTRIARSQHVPCGVIHRGYSPYPAWRRLSRILAFQVAVCLPGERCRWMRARSASPGAAWNAIGVDDKVAFSRAGRNGELWWSGKGSAVAS